MTKLHEEPSPNLEAFLAKAARVSNQPTTEDIRREQEAQMDEVQRALQSYSVPVVVAAPDPVKPAEVQPNKLPPRTVKVPRYLDKHNA